MQKKRIIIEIANKLLYDEEKSEFSQKADLILQKIVDILREYSHYPFTIKLYVLDDNDPTARSKRDLLRTYISKHLLLLPEAVDIRISQKEERGLITAFTINR